MERHVLFFLAGFIYSLTSLHAQDQISADGDLVVLQKSFKLPVSLQKSGTSFDIDPGDSVEGDFIRDLEFFDNGNKLLISNFVTGNVSVLDWASQVPVADIPLGGNAMYVTTAGNVGAASMPLDDSTAILDLGTNSVIAKIATPGEPNRLRIDPQNNRLLVSSLDSQRCYVIDLNSNQIVNTLDSFFSGIQTFSFITSNNRSDFDYYDFMVSPAGTKALSIALGGVGISVHDINSGNIDTTFRQINNPFSMAMSDSGKAFILNNNPTPALYRIDLNSFQVDSISFTGRSIFSLCRNFVPNAAGDKVVLVLGGGLVYADFNSLSFSNASTSTAFWLEPSADNQFAVAGGFFTQIVDMSLGTVVASYTGLSQSKGAVSDSALHFVGIDVMRKEFGHSFDYDGIGINLIGSVNSGSTKEADAPYRVAVTDDGARVFVANQLSRSASIIRTDSMEVENLVQAQATQSFGCAVTSDGQYGLVADYENFAIHVIHLETGTIVASPAVGDRPSIIRVVPGDSIALVTNTRGNTVSFVRLDSANSTNITDISVGTIGVSWTNQGIFSDLQVLPTGDYALLAASFDDNVKVIDIAQRSIVATLSVGDFPSQIAISDNGLTAAVLNKSDDNFSLIALNGAFSSVIGVRATDGNPTRITYNDSTDEFIVCSSGNQTVQVFDAGLGTLNNTINFGPAYTPLQTAVLSSGKVAYLLGANSGTPQSVLRVDGIDYPLPARPCFMHAAKNEDILAIAMSGPDYVAVFEGDSLTVSLLKASDPLSMSVYPNPSQGAFTIKFPEMIKNGLIELYDINGACVKKITFADRRELQLEFEGLTSGVFTLRVNGSDKAYKKRIIIE